MNQLQDMPHFTTGNKRMTNVPVGNGEYISGIRRNENLGKEELIMSGISGRDGQDILILTRS